MKTLNAVLNSIIVTFFLTLVGIVFVQVICRFVLGSALSWAEEFAQMLFVWLVYLGGIIAVRKGINISFDVFLEAMPFKIWTVVFTFVNIVCVGFLIVAFIVGFQIANMNMKQTSAIMRIPMGIAYLAVPIGALGMIISQFQYYKSSFEKRRAEA